MLADYPQQCKVVSVIVRFLLLLCVLLLFLAHRLKSLHRNMYNLYLNRSNIHTIHISVWSFPWLYNLQFLRDLIVLIHFSFLTIKFTSWISSIHPCPVWPWPAPTSSQTLPKAQRTRGLSSYNKFKQKSWSSCIFRISTKHQTQNLNQTSVSP